MSFERLDFVHSSPLIAHSFDRNRMILANRTQRGSGSESAGENAPLEKA